MEKILEYIYHFIAIVVAVLVVVAGWYFVLSPSIRAWYSLGESGVTISFLFWHTPVGLLLVAGIGYLLWQAYRKITSFLK